MRNFKRFFKIGKIFDFNELKNFMNQDSEFFEELCLKYEIYLECELSDESKEKSKFNRNLLDIINIKIDQGITEKLDINLDPKIFECN